MNFDLDESQRLLEETLLRLFAKDFDLRRVREVFESESGMDKLLWQQLAGVGLFGILASEEYGGAGLGLLDLVAAADALGYSAVPGPFFEQAVAVAAIDRAGSDEQKQRWLPDLINGDLRATIAFGEAGEQWWPDEWTFESEDLTGTKVACLYPEGADLILVGTRAGISVIEGGALGLSIVDVDSLDRTRRIASVDFDDVAAEPLPGGHLETKLVDLALILLAADAAGGARRCLELAVDYAKSREQFGVTIGHFQGLKHQLADMAVEVLPLQQLVWYAAHAFDVGLPDASKFAALAKAHVTEQYVVAARRTVELHGGIGYTWECDVQFFLKRAVFDRAYLGAPSAHYQRVAEINGWATSTTSTS